MRVIANLAHPENTATDGNEEAMRGIKSVDELLPHACDIIAFLKKDAKKNLYHSFPAGK